jgi:hypothetical protein
VFINRRCDTIRSASLATSPKVIGLPVAMERNAELGITQSIFRPASRRESLGMEIRGDRRDGGLKMGWTKPLPSAWPLGIHCRLDLGRGCDVPGSNERAQCFVGSGCRQRPMVMSGGVRSVAQIFFGMTRLAMLLPSLGSAKLVRYSWIWIRKQSSPS